MLRPFIAVWVVVIIVVALIPSPDSHSMILPFGGSVMLSPFVSGGRGTASNPGGTVVCAIGAAAAAMGYA